MQSVDFAVGDTVFFRGLIGKRGTIKSISPLDGSILIEFIDGQIEIVKPSAIFKRSMQRYAERNRDRIALRKAFGLD